MRDSHHPDRKDVSEQAKAKILGENDQTILRLAMT